jgi:hypothetical protein
MDLRVVQGDLLDQDVDVIVEVPSRVSIHHSETGRAWFYGWTWRVLTRSAPARGRNALGCRPCDP